MQLHESLVDRDSWSAQGACPVEAAVRVIGSRASMLIIREAYYGTRRFDEFVSRVAMAPATASAHLSALVDAGLLERHRYREQGARAREDYRLTQAGRDLVPVVLGLFQWGRRHTAVKPPADLVHVGCGESVTVSVQCGAGHHIALEDIELRPVP